MTREKLGSRLGFILLSAGCAIGIGNVWKFPYMVGQYGGGIFVLIYLLFLVILGVPVMVMEFSMGRAARKSPVKIYQEIEKKGSKWHIHGYICMLGNYLLMMYYTTVAGWMIQYFVKMAKGDFAGKKAEDIALIFSDCLSDPLIQVSAMAVVVAVGFFINSKGLQNGLERITKIMMAVLLLVMVILAINSCLIKDSYEGLEFYLKPSLKNIEEIGLLKVIAGAMNQAFFTLSLGIGAMAIFGSYIDKDRSLLGESLNVALLDTFVAIVSGLIIFPACFAYGVEPDAGPSLIFITLPNIFNHMNFGRVWGTLFFIFMTVAAFSTVLAVFENIMACTMDLFGWKRGKSALINGIVLFILSLPCALGFNLLSFFEPFGKGSNVLDFEDFLVSNILLPGGSLVFILFCVSRYGWGWKNFVNEANEGKGIKTADWMRPYMTYILPVLVGIILVLGIVEKM
ncbi:neurotransmitter:Na+ symporter, NSS family [Acetitomaculum ruminis DSM 5522]|uniref:Transporter n=1 Tax=Acetitomaculum ruminis DSM 5522 TaxID=1120918 RepID=A0A1I0ZNR1_9FIRM|nr:sodium-dependent transporter [Acetitomaculum ruminis]SFB27285.1 neurotransmitter:Na+ symporter, NSS family [Acetitomaculum ruminis DSM 5522]